MNHDLTAEALGLHEQADVKRDPAAGRARRPLPPHRCQVDLRRFDIEPDEAKRYLTLLATARVYGVNTAYRDLH